ncbi:MAG TPA: hypothetical protein VEB64_04715 [Azospirillaceae bacterium]|nr:hypothetical protein [Azospirillaceae bacterium]
MIIGLFGNGGAVAAPAQPADLPALPTGRAGFVPGVPLPLPDEKEKRSSAQGHDETRMSNGQDKALLLRSLGIATQPTFIPRKLVSKPVPKAGTMNRPLSLDERRFQYYATLRQVTGPDTGCLIGGALFGKWDVVVAFFCHRHPPAVEQQPSVMAGTITETASPSDVATAEDYRAWEFMP